MTKQRRNRSQGKKTGKLSRYYIRSGVMKNSFCVIDSDYKMTPPVSHEQLERAGIENAFIQ